MYLGRIYSPLTGGRWLDIPAGAMCVDGDGRIVEIGQASEMRSACQDARIVDFSGELILPGLVDCHQHLTHYDWTRLIPDLLTWLETIYELELRFEDLAYAQHTSESFFRELLQHGTTTACVHGPYFHEATRIAFSVARRFGNRITMGMNQGDLNLPNPLRRAIDDSLMDAVRLHDEWNGVDSGRLRYCFTVRPAYCASRQLLVAVAKKAYELDAWIQGHLSEDAAGVHEILANFPECGSDTEVYQNLGLLSRKTIMAHGIYLRPGDTDRLAGSGTGIVHCPRANLLAGGRQADTHAIRAKGISLALGSDLGAGKNLSMFRVMEDAFKVTPSLDIHTLFRWATLDGAKLLGLADEVGSLEPGKGADFIVVHPPWVERNSGFAVSVRIDDLLASLVFSAGAENVRNTFIQGQLCPAKGDLTLCP